MPRGRPRKNPIGEEAVQTSPKKRGRPRKDAGAEKSKYVKKFDRQGELYFALDIGTRTVVGVVGEKREEDFRVLECVSIPHSRRAMIDGQIEDIDEVARIAAKVKAQLEKDLGVKLSKVSIAAAGRALRTQHVRVDIDIDGRDTITEDMVRSFEIEAVQQAQAQLDAANDDDRISFYCVGNSVVNYYLDDYPIKSFVGHKGKTATVDMLAAFLPSIVVESLYSVTDKLGLEVQSLTLEPIAAMNVLIPPEVRLINIALVDIGAGTSDIAVAKGGSIIAYAMATTAGDEITEEIIKSYLVDFETAERMKFEAGGKDIAYNDILGIEHKVSSADFFKKIFPAVDLLASTISDNIIESNGGEAPSAVFLIGGGSLVEGLPENIAKRLGIPAERVAVGSSKILRRVVADDPDSINGPEFITPIGIGVTATMSQGYDFSTILLNGKKIRVFNKNRISMLDLLSMAGYRSVNLIGRSGRNLSFTLDGEQKFRKGEPSTPAVITVNGLPANINTEIQKGDSVNIVPAENGADATMLLSDIISDYNPITVKLSGMDYSAGVFATVNGTVAEKDYRIANFDDIRTTRIVTLADLLEKLEATGGNLILYKGKRKLTPDYILENGDEYTVEEAEILTPAVEEPEEIPEVIAEEFPEEEYEEYIPEPAKEEKPVAEEKPAEVLPEKAEEPPVEEYNGITVTLNGKPITLGKPVDSNINIFLELLAFADIDTENPQGDDIEMLRNGKAVSYMDELHDGDHCSIKWIKRR